MPTITITLTDLQGPGANIIVATDAARPRIGKPVTQAEALAMELLGTAFKRGALVAYDSRQVPCIALALELLDPEGFGHTATPEIRAAAVRALGRTPAEIRADAALPPATCWATPTAQPAPTPPSPGVDIDRVHTLRKAGAL